MRLNKRSAKVRYFEVVWKVSIWSLVIPRSPKSELLILEPPAMISLASRPTARIDPMSMRAPSTMLPVFTVQQQHLSMTAMIRAGLKTAVS